MNKASSRVVAACVAGATICLVLSSAARAQSVRASAETEVTGGYSKNPSRSTSGGDSTFVEGRLSPDVRVISEHSSLTVNGKLRLRHFFSRIRDERTVELDANYERRLSPFTTLTAGASGTITRNTLEDLSYDLDASVPDVGDDLNLINTTIKRFGGNASGTFVVSPLMSLSINGSARATRYSADSLGGYDSFLAGGSLSRKLSEHASGGVFVSISQNNYRQATRADASIYSAGVTGSLQPGPHLNMNGQLGISKVNYGRIPGSTGGSVSSVVGNLTACRSGEHDSVCASASRQYLPTGLVGTVPQTRLSLSYSRHIGQYDDASLTGGIVQSGRASTAAVGSETVDSSGNKFLRSELRFSHGFNSRLRAVVSTFYRKLIDNPSSGAGDYGGRIGLSYRFGDRR